PLLGERVYSKGYQGQLLPAPRVMLHAASLGFDHPTEAGRRLQFHSETPTDFAQTLTALK
ncbi:MAG TPA: RluA family pseudouridine synthase, partial [Polyangiaceae bacterium]|nr:RluA family pseudouridine synthase [Polyangiaceae bacterium]